MAQPSKKRRRDEVEPSNSETDLNKIDKADVSSFLLNVGQMQRINEIDRILDKTFRLNPLDVMGLSSSATTVEVNKKYRTISLLVHPDKSRTEDRGKAQDAFHRLTEARKTLLDEDKRKGLNELIGEARNIVAERHKKEAAKKRRKLNESSSSFGTTANETEEIEEKPLSEEAEPEIMKELRQLLIDREWRKKKLLEMAAKLDGKASKEMEERKVDRDAKKKVEREWEDNREKRVSSWRDWNKKTKKKKKKKKRFRGMAPISNLVVDDEKTYIKRVQKIE